MEEPREEVYFDLTIKDKQGNIISEDGDPTIGIGIDIRKEEGNDFALLSGPTLAPCIQALH